MADDTSPLGLASGAVALRDSDARWAALYRDEAARLRAAIGNLAVGIEHIGSTAVPGIKAKPILDVMIGLRRFDDGEALVGPLTALGYEYLGTELVPLDHMFGLGEPRTHHVHAVEHGGYHWVRNLRFRDRMLADPGLAARYEAFKVTLATRFAGQRAAYTAAKKDFIDAIADAAD